MQIEHIAIWVKDIEKMKSFYEKYFNARSSSIYINDLKQFSPYFLSFETGARLEIMHTPKVSVSGDYDEQVAGFVHLAFATGSDENVEKLTKKLAKDGLKILDGPRRTGDGYYESVILDPEGNRIEITR